MDAQRNFRDDLAASKSTDSNSLAISILTRLYPSASLIETSSDSEDRLGADVWLNAYKRLGIDVKFRAQDCRNFGADDLCLEIQCGNQAGWALEPGPLTDLFVWIWKDTARFYVCNAFEVSAVARIMAPKWRSKYAKTTRSVGKHEEYQTVCVYPPLREFERCLALWRRGELRD